MAFICPVSQSSAEYYEHGVFSDFGEIPRIQGDSLFVPAVSLDIVFDEGVGIWASHDPDNVMTFDVFADYMHRLILLSHCQPHPTAKPYYRFLEATSALFLETFLELPIKDVPPAVMVLEFLVWDWTRPYRSQYFGLETQEVMMQMGLDIIWADAGLGFDFSPLENLAIFMGPLVSDMLTNTNIKLVETDSERIGLCPVQTKPGDIVCMLRASPFQSVLRKTGDHYLHVGTCFFPSITDAEVTRLVGSGEANREVVEIR